MTGAYTRHNHKKLALKSVISVPKAVTVYFYDFSPDYVSAPDIHDFWEMHYCDGGEYEYLVSGETHKLHKGDVILIRPMAHHVVKCDGVHPASVFIISFDCKSAALKQFANRTVTVSDYAKPYLKMLIDECSRTFESSTYPLTARQSAGFGGEQMVRNCLESFIIALIRSEYESGGDNRGNAGDDVAASGLAGEIEAYLRDNLCRHVTLDELSERFHFGKSHICEEFRQTFGDTVISYHTGLKIEEAKKLLRRN